MVPRQLRERAWHTFGKYSQRSRIRRRLEMANPFYEPGAQRGVRVKELFSRIASHYDFINDLQSFGLHRQWRKRLVKLAEPGPGKLALDVCCGTGDLALGLARQGAKVVGVDFTAPMLQVAQVRTVHQRTTRRVEDGR